MGRISKLKTLRKADKKRRTTLLKEVIGTDLISWKEKLVNQQTSGLYNLTDEQAYFKVHGDASAMSVPEFERKLQTELDNNFRVVFNSYISSSEHIIQGHSIYYLVDAFDGYIKVCNVGKNSDNIIPAESVGKIVQYKGEEYKDRGIMDEEPLLYRGWIAAFEACKLAYESWEHEGISPAMCINEKEIFKLKEAIKIIGFKEQLDKAKNVMQDILELPVPLIAVEDKTEDKVPQNGLQEEIEPSVEGLVEGLQEVHKEDVGE